MVYMEPVQPPSTPAPNPLANGIPESVVLPGLFASLMPTDHNAASQAQLDIATQLVEEHIHRPLRTAIWTERLMLHYDEYVDPFFGFSGTCSPSAIPLQSVVTPVGAVISKDKVELLYVPPDDDSLLFFGSSSSIEIYSTVTYQGGWSPQSLPLELGGVICKVAYRILQRASGDNSIPIAGSSRPRVGRVSFATNLLYGGWFDDSDIAVMKPYYYRTF